MLNMGIHDYDDCLLKTYHFESVFTSLVSFLANGFQEVFFFVSSGVESVLGGSFTSSLASFLANGFHEVFFDSSGLESVFGGSFAIPWGDSLG